MSIIRARGEIIHPTDSVVLTASFKDQYGNYVDTDTYPAITLISPTNIVIVGPTTAGVARDDVGRYSYVYNTNINPPFGIYNDVWQAYIAGSFVENKFSFIVNYSQVPESVNSDGYLALGDIPGFDYSQTAIANINKLLKILKQRLNSSGKSKATDQYGNTIYIDCDIFSIETLVTFLNAALMDFNQVPYFTWFNWDDVPFVNQFGEILVEGATLYSLASIALLEKGKMINITDNGINVQLPDMADLLNTQYAALSTAYNDKLKNIKLSLRPKPQGLGLFNMSSGGLNPAIKRLRHLRSRRIY